MFDKLPANIRAKIDRTDSCWLWTGGKNTHGSTRRGGYGMGRALGKRWRIHRLVWTVAYGVIPDGTKVLHTCDVRHCCNPRHLFLGSNQDNSDDMVAKGRSSRGDRNARSKLTEADVRELHRLAGAGATRQALVSQFKISRTQVYNILHYKKWSHIR